MTDTTGTAAANGDGGSNGSGGSTDWGSIVDSIFEGVNGAIDTFYEAQEQKWAVIASNPCIGVVALEEFEATMYRPTMARAVGTASAISQALRRDIGESLRTLGHSGGTGTPLEVWLNNQIGTGPLTPTAEEPLTTLVGFLTMGASLGPGGIATLATIRGRLPTYAEIQAGIGTDERGLKVGPDVYLWANGVADNPTTAAEQSKARRIGRLRGARVRDEVDLWVLHQIAEVIPPGYGSPRQNLARLVGTDSGSGEFGIWVPGDPISETSKIGELIRLRDDIRERTILLDGRCVEWQAEQAELRRYAAETERADRLATAGAATTIAGYGAAVAAFVAVLALRRR